MEELLVHRSTNRRYKCASLLSVSLSFVTTGRFTSGLQRSEKARSQQPAPCSATPSQRAVNRLMLNERAGDAAFERVSQASRYFVDALLSCGQLASH